MKSTVRHLGIEVDGALETSKSIDIGLFRTAERRHSYQAGYELMDVFQSANRSLRTNDFGDMLGRTSNSGRLRRVF